MKIPYRVLLFLLLIFPVTIWAQDTLKLEEVTIYGIPMEKYSAGSKIMKIAPEVLRKHREASLATLLAMETPVYFRGRGNGMLSTISFRGTDPSHTALLWNGININSFSLGQADFAAVPMAGIQQVAVHYGPSAALYGSDAIGGSIHLTNEPLWTEGISMGLRGSYGSFGYQGLQLNGSYGNGKWEGRSLYYRNKADNNFPITLNAGRPSEQTYRRDHASFAQQGFQQDIYYRPSSNRYFSLNAWHSEMERQIQPTDFSRQPNGFQEDQSTRVVAAYHHHGQAGYFQTRAGYVHDIIRFNNSATPISRMIGAFRYENAINDNITAKFGTDYQYITADVPNYGGAIAEHRTDFFLLLTWDVSPRLHTSFNLRQAFVTGFQAPLAPSIGSIFTFYHTDMTSLQWKANISRSYRVPTLNDRFWQPGGNPELLPEDAWGAETGLVYQLQKFSAELTAFTNYVDNWIAWRPVAGNVWQPMNVQEVHSRGIEALVSQNFTLGEVNMKTGLNYAYTRSTQETPRFSGDANVGNQLIYVPEHSGLAFLHARFRQWNGQLNYNRVGDRFTQFDNSRSLPAYSLVDIALEYDVKWLAHGLDIALQANNILDQPYQNFLHNSMPGRNFLLSLRYHFNQN